MGQRGLFRAHYVGNLGVLLLEERGRRGVLEGRFLNEGSNLRRDKLWSLEDGVFVIGLRV